MRSDSKSILRMIRAVENIRDVERRYNLDLSKGYTNLFLSNKDAVDLCLFYLAQFNSQLSKLSSETMIEIYKVIDLDSVVLFDGFDSVDKDKLISDIINIKSNDVLKCLSDLLK